MKTIFEWLWQLVTGDCLTNIYSSRRDLQRLNSVHVDFLDDLKKHAKHNDDPHLAQMVEAHEYARFKAIHD